MSGPPSALPSWRSQALLAIGLTLATFAAYRATLLPGFDFGDTAALQAAGRDPNLTPRQAYPLYYGLGQLVVRIVGGEPAYGMNVASALAAAAACGTLAVVGTLASGSLVGGAVAALLLGGSYTFWSQAVIAEVYALHLLLMGLVLLALLAWDRKPKTSRLLLVCLVYALSFGNHLMSVLIAPAVVAFVASRKEGRQALANPRVLALAAVCAVAGASQYLWNFVHLWRLPEPPADLAEALHIFWFDVTKADWRESLVLGIHESAVSRRAGLYWFDLRQQVGVPGVLLAAGGLIDTAWRHPRRAALLGLAWAPAFAFAYTYNVGDVHVFFLPSHQILILAAAMGAAALYRLGRDRRPQVADVALAALLVAWPLTRAWDTWPVVDRSADHRPREWVSRLTSGLDHRAVLLADLNWQAQNGLMYYTRHLRPELNVTSAWESLPTLPFLVRANHEIGREILATPHSERLVVSAYGEVFHFTPDPRGEVAPLAGRIADLPSGSRYVLTVLASDPELGLDWDELDAAVAHLTSGTATVPRGASYSILAGTIGAAPLFQRRDDRPFREVVVLDGLRLDVRMESWLPADTIRRGGFGHVVAGRRPLLTIERGVSFLAASPEGAALRIDYASSLFAPLRRARLGVLPAPAP